MSDTINIAVTPPATQTTNVVVTPPTQTVVNISTNNSAPVIAVNGSPTVYPVASPGARFVLSPSVVKNGDIVTCFGNPEIFTITFNSGISDTAHYDVHFYDINGSDPYDWTAPACATTSLAATAFGTWISDYGVCSTYLISVVANVVTIGRYSYTNPSRTSNNTCSTISFTKTSGSGSMSIGPTVAKTQSMGTYGGTWVVVDRTQIHNDQGYLFSNWINEAPLDGNLWVRQNGEWAEQGAINPFNQSLNTSNSVKFLNISTLNGLYETKYDDGFGETDYWVFGASDNGAFNFAYTGTSVFTVLSDGAIIFRPKTSAPSAEEGAIYYNSTTHHFYGYNGTAWKQLDNTI
jgi:hypothetical protein